MKHTSTATDGTIHDDAVLPPLQSDLSPAVTVFNSSYADVTGWMDFEDIYLAALSRTPVDGYMIEVGALYGQSVIFLAQEAVRHGKSALRIDAADVWLHDLYPRFDANVKACEVDHLIHRRRLTSLDAAGQTPDESADFIMLDADHSYEAIRQDILAWWPKLKIGGWLAAHDYANMPQVRRAFDEIFGNGHLTGVCSALVEKTGTNLWQHEPVSLPHHLSAESFPARSRWHTAAISFEPAKTQAMEMMAFHAMTDGLRGVRHLVTLLQHPGGRVADIARESLLAMLAEDRPLVDREAAVQILLAFTGLEHPLATRWAAMRQLKQLPRNLIQSADRLAHDSAIRDGAIIDGLRRMEINFSGKLTTRRCIATVISPGYEGQLDLMLESLSRVGQVSDATLVIFLVDADEACRAVAKKYGAHVFEARSLTKRTSAVKGCLYTLYDCVEADSYLLLEADLIVMDSLRELFEEMETTGKPAIAGVGAAPHELEHVGKHRYRDFNFFFEVVVGAAEEDWRWITGKEEWVRPTKFSYANGGVIAANRAGMQRMTQVCCELQPFFHTWMDCAPPHIYWREEFCFNVIAALEDMIVELPERYNVQLHSPVIMPRIWKGKAYYNDTPAVVLHFADRRGKQLFPMYARELGIQSTA